MDKIKNVLSPGKAHNDETLAGQSTGTITNTGAGGGLTGEGSHLAQASNTPAGTASGLAGNQTSGITNTSGPSDQHQTGRDAAVGAGGVGLAEHEHRKHETEQGLGSTTTGSGLGNNQNSGYSPNTTTTGPHSSNLVNKADPVVDSDNSKNIGNSSVAGRNTTPKHHLGRDAAAVGTTGVVGEGIHHHRKNERGLALNTGTGYTGANPDSSYHTGPVGTSVQGPHGSGTANLLDPNVNTSGTEPEDSHRHSATHGGGAEAADRHHLGRDTAIGAGGVSFAEYEHHKHENEPITGAEATSGIGPSATGQTTTSSRHHLGRDAAVGSFGVGLAENEHRKHGNEHRLSSGTTSEVTSSTTGTSPLPGPAPNTAGPHSKDWMNKLDPRVDANPTTSSMTGQTSTLPQRGIDPDVSADRKSHHLSKEAAVGTAGVAGHEHNKHHDRSVPLAEKPIGTDLGDKLHGVERNRGVPGASRIAGRSEATTDQYGNPLPFDAGHRRNDSGYAAGTDSHKTGHYDNTMPSSGLSRPHQTGHLTGRDVTDFGGAGLVGEHEYRKHEVATGQYSSLTDSNTQGQFHNTNTDSNLTGSNIQPGIAGSNTSGLTGVNEGVDGRTRLHKDPPASHPAAQRNQVPASDAERENLLNQGQERIDKDTGVANLHADGGVNAASNL